MNAPNIIAELQAKFGDKRIVCLPESDPSEIICELEPTSNHPDFSITLCVIDASAAHLHRRSTETYEVLRGKLTLWVDNRPIGLQNGETYTVKPGSVHFTTGQETWVKVRSEPGWTPDDHLLK